MNHRDRDDLVISEMNAAHAALGNRSGIGQRSPTNSDNNEQTQTCGDFLDGLLHVLVNVVHPGGLEVRTDRRSCARSSVSQAYYQDIGGRYREFNRIGSGDKISVNEGVTGTCHTMEGTYQYQCRRGENIDQITYCD